MRGKNKSELFMGPHVESKERVRKGICCRGGLLGQMPLLRKLLGSSHFLELWDGLPAPISIPAGAAIGLT